MFVSDDEEKLELLWSSIVSPDGFESVLLTQNFRKQNFLAGHERNIDTLIGAFGSSQKSRELNLRASLDRFPRFPFLTLSQNQRVFIKCREVPRKSGGDDLNHTARTNGTVNERQQTDYWKKICHWMNG